jgi:hypothetical protein
MDGYVGVCGVVIPPDPPGGEPPSEYATEYAAPEPADDE